MKGTQLTCSTLLIFAANELGWTDLTDACDGLHHTQCPVEATRIYNKRWHTFPLPITPVPGQPCSRGASTGAAHVG